MAGVATEVLTFPPSQPLARRRRRRGLLAPFPATASAEGAQFNVPPSPARGEGAILDRCSRGAFSNGSRPLPLASTGPTASTGGTAAVQAQQVGGRQVRETNQRVSPLVSHARARRCALQ